MEADLLINDKEFKELFIWMKEELINFHTMTKGYCEVFIDPDEGCLVIPIDCHQVGSKDTCIRCQRFNKLNLTSYIIKCVNKFNK